MKKNLAYFQKCLKKGTVDSLPKILEDIEKNTAQLYAENPDKYNRMMAWVDHALGIWVDGKLYTPFPKF